LEKSEKSEVFFTMSTPRGNAVIGQSGGPTAVINQSLVGVVLEAAKSAHIDQLLGARHGMRGILKENFLRLNGAPADLLERIAQTPSAALGSTRDKPKQADCEQMFRVFAKNNVRYFFYIGGNDSADAARIIHDLGKAENYDLRVFHIPKTIDNDLRVHDHCPGFGSAARYVAAAIMGDNFDNKSLPGIKIDIIMGRDAGFLTAASVLARKRDDDGPHLIYVPEMPLSQEQFLADVDRVYKKYGRCLVAASEGIKSPDGKRWTEKIKENLGRDAHQNVQLSGTGALGDYLADWTKKLGDKLRVRADTFGYPQRSFPGFASEVDSREARLVGQMAVRYSADDANRQGSVAMRRLSGAGKYAVETFLTPLETVARETRPLDPEFIVGSNNIADSFKAYAAPLVGSLPVVGSFDEWRA
jgi:6-phosphofructokinase 1